MLSDVHRDVAQTSGGEDGLAVVAQHSPGCGGEVGGGDPTEYIREEVEPDIVEVVNKAGTALDGQDGPYFPRPTDVEADQACAELRRRIISATWPAPRTSLVVADRTSDVLIGRVSWYFESEVTDWRRIGVVLYDPASWSGGRGTEAVRLWTDYLFATTEIVRLDFATWSGNAGMCRIGSKLGWTEEARFRDAPGRPGTSVRQHRVRRTAPGVDWLDLPLDG